jgi:hypothetical protein
MRQLWAAIASVWVLLSIVAVLAWTRVPPAPAPQSTPTVLIQRQGKAAHRVVPAPASPVTHTTTQTSPPPP